MGNTARALTLPSQTRKQKRFVSIVERHIEAGHSIVSRKVTPNGGGVVVSLARRLPQLGYEVAVRPETLPELASFFDKSRHVCDIPKLLNISSHPDLLATVTGKKGAREKTGKQLALILYSEIMYVYTGTIIY